MGVNTEAYKKIKSVLNATGATLVAVSKFKTAEDIMALYELGHRDFGENFVQELLIKEAVLPKDIRWHFIGHLQSNKVKFIAPFIYLIHGVDSEKLVKEIDKQASRLGRKINCLLQVFIADEATKFGFSKQEIAAIDFIRYNNINFLGLMGMASFTEDTEKIKKEFHFLKMLSQDVLPAKNESFSPTILSMGMSGDYEIALTEGSNMVRIGSLLFGKRDTAAV